MKQNHTHQSKHRKDDANIMIDAEYDYQKGQEQNPYDMREPSVSEVVQSLFQENIENNQYNQSESKKHKHKVLKQKPINQQGNKNHSTPQQGIFQSLMSINPLNSWSNGYKDELNNFDKLESEKQKYYQKQFSAIVDNDLDTNKFNTWTQQRELNEVIKELSQTPNDYISSFGQNLQSKIQAIMNGDHLKNPIGSQSKQTEQLPNETQEKIEKPQAKALSQETKTQNFDTNFEQNWKYLQAQAWNTIAIGLTYFQPISATFAYGAQSLYEVMKFSVESGQAKLKQVQKQYEISDLGFILLFAVLVAMLFVMCCIFFCMGRMMIAMAICFIALIIVVVAALLYMNKVNSKHEHDHAQENDMQ